MLLRVPKILARRKNKGDNATTPVLDSVNPKIINLDATVKLKEEEQPVECQEEGVHKLLHGLKEIYIFQCLPTSAKSISPPQLRIAPALSRSGGLIIYGAFQDEFFSAIAKT